MTIGKLDHNLPIVKFGVCKIEADRNLKAHKRRRGGRERLLQAAAELFQAHRVAGTSLQMVADRLGVSKAAIYHHFRSRDDIIAALMAPVIGETEQAVDEIAALPPAARPDAARRFYADFVVRHRAIISAVFFDRPALPAELSAGVDALVDVLAGLMASDGSPAADAHARMLIYGVAGFVAEPRQHLLGDAELGLRVSRLLTCAEEPLPDAG